MRGLKLAPKVRVEEWSSSWCGEEGGTSFYVLVCNSAEVLAEVCAFHCDSSSVFSMQGRGLNLYPSSEEKGRVESVLNLAPKVKSRREEGRGASLISRSEQMGGVSFVQRCMKSGT